MTALLAVGGQLISSTRGWLLIVGLTGVDELPMVNIDECVQRRVGFYAVHMGIVYTDAHASSLSSKRFATIPRQQQIKAQSISVQGSTVNSPYTNHNQYATSDPRQN